MTQKYLQISTTKETRRIFNEYFEKNKEYFGTKATMFRFMVYNLDPEFYTLKSIKLS
ncbi:hypothetical protein CIRMBP1298_02187 [Enterococcus cecorum]|nr:hypothetical protein CIRMBP1298_02187 [Enterococcus cecorum]